MTSILAIEALTIDYLGQPPKRPAKRLVDGISLTLEQGRSLALVGESGAGKSLTSLAVMDLLPLGIVRASGRIVIGGRTLDGLSIEAKRQLRGGMVTMIMQNPMSAFDPVFTIRSHFAETLAAHDDGKSGRGSVAERARIALAEAGFPEPEAVLEAYPFQMSGGMLQRVMIALALVTGPELLIADEATTDLDAVSQKRVIDLLRREREKRNLSLLLITHDLSVAASLADDIAVMHQGKIVESGPAHTIFTAPQKAYTQKLINAHNRLYRSAFTAFGYDNAGDAHAACVHM